MSHLGAQRQIDHDARGCLLRLLKAVLGALQSALTSQSTSTAHLNATRTAQGSRCGQHSVLNVSSKQPIERKDEATYRTSEISSFKVRVPPDLLLLSLLVPRPHLSPSAR